MSASREMTREEVLEMANEQRRRADAAEAEVARLRGALEDMAWAVECADYAMFQRHPDSVWRVRCRGCGSRWNGKRPMALDEHDPAGCPVQRLLLMATEALAALAPPPDDDVSGPVPALGGPRASDLRPSGATGSQPGTSGAAHIIEGPDGGPRPADGQTGSGRRPSGSDRPDPPPDDDGRCMPEPNGFVIEELCDADD